MAQLSPMVKMYADLVEKGLRALEENLDGIKLVDSRYSAEVALEVERRKIEKQATLQKMEAENAKLAAAIEAQRQKTEQETANKTETPEENYTGAEEYEPNKNTGDQELPDDDTEPTEQQ